MGAGVADEEKPKSTQNQNQSAAAQETKRDEEKKFETVDLLSAVPVPVHMDKPGFDYGASKESVNASNSLRRSLMSNSS